MIFQIQTLDRAILRVGVNNVWIARCRNCVFAVTANHGVPGWPGNPSAAQVRRRAAPRTVVLQSAANVVRLTAVRGDHVELLDGHAVEEAPRLRAVRG